MNALKGLLSKAQSLADNAVAPMRDHVPPSLAQIQQQVAAIGANAAPVDGAAGVTMQVELKVPVGEGERALKLLQQRKQKIFKAKDRFESNAAIDDLNLEQHVEEHFHQILDTAALESAQTSDAAFRSMMAHRMESEWDDLMRSLTVEHELHIPRAGGMGAAVGAALPPAMRTSVHITAHQEKYAMAVRDMNVQRLGRDQPVSNAAEWLRLAAEAGSAFLVADGEAGADLKLAWKVLETMQVKVIAKKSAIAMARLDDADRLDAMRLGALEVLEAEFFDAIKLPGVQQTPFAPMQNEAMKQPPLQGEHFERVWRILYYCLRANQIAAATSCLQRMEALAPIAAQARVIRAALGTWGALADAGISDQQRAQLTQSRDSHQGGDPHRSAVYALLLRESLAADAMSAVIGDSNDWLWFNLRIAHRGNPTVLANLHREIDAMGASHFDCGGVAPLKYVLVLLLSLQLDKAIIHMWTYDTARSGAQFQQVVAQAIPVPVEGVHFAIAASTAASDDACLLGSRRHVLLPLGGQQPLFTVLEQWVSDLQLVSPGAALHYWLALLPAGSGDAQWLATDAQPEIVNRISNLIRTTRAFDDLIGPLPRSVFSNVPPAAQAQGHLALTLSGGRFAALLKHAAAHALRWDDAPCAIRMYLGAKMYGAAGENLARLLSARDATGGALVKETVAHTARAAAVSLLRELIENAPALRAQSSGDPDALAAACHRDLACLLQLAQFHELRESHPPPRAFRPRPEWIAFFSEWVSRAEQLGSAQENADITALVREALAVPRA